MRDKCTLYQHHSDKLWRHLAGGPKTRIADYIAANHGGNVSIGKAGGKWGEDNHKN